MREITDVKENMFYGLKQFKMPKEEAAAMAVYLNEENQMQMVRFLASHPKAVYHEIMNEFGRLLKEQNQK